MNAMEILRSSLRGMTSNPMRSVLTLLGVLIGVGSVILLVGVGAGSAKAVSDQIDSLGTTTLTVRSGSGGGIRFQDLTTGVADALQSSVDSGDATALIAVVPEVTSSQTITAGTSSTTAQIIGTTANYFDVTSSKVAQGTAFTANDLTQSRRVVVIGAELATTLFGSQGDADYVDPVGQTVVVGSTPYLVNGVMAAKDSTGTESTNNVLVVPLTRVQQSIAGYGNLSSIVLQASDAGAVDVAEAEATTVINTELKIESTDDATYTISNQAQLLAASTSTASTFSAMLAAVAGISLLVGGIGVTNIMLVTVTERTREIGIRKALGATRGAILGQFLTEATLLSLLGGALGVLGAVIGSQFEILGVKPAIVGSSVVLALGVSIGIGVFFGGYPAFRAAKMRPVDALRHE
ncbi:macrolide ABC transporter permease [Cellulomonas sp. WB94]|uniref:ABC transporter permease n=1 Tax=Cellulomonas sp. WB94 TaxID=2173174 RepID=UPI000D566AB1|nr:ABC transporter permease [Cellulomonas sp. WB94]PVU82507.1 macrolide ABC transporter permease [Cellulomonas sp. WB94]